MFVWLPTGYGKSICFQVLPYVVDFKLGRLAREVQAMTGTIAKWRCIIVNKPDILSMYFFRARPRRVADKFTVNFTEMLAHAHAKVPGRFFLLRGLGTRLELPNRRCYIGQAEPLSVHAYISSGGYICAYAEFT